MKRAVIGLLLVLVLGLHAPIATAQDLSPATFVAPVNGAVHPLGHPISWTSRPGALAYYLYVGTAPGLKNLIDSRETQVTEWPSGSLPTDVPLFARIHTKYEGKWVNASVEFTIRPVATFSNPATNGAAVTPNFRFEWLPVSNAQAYYLYVGTAPGKKDIVDSREVQTTYFDARNLPVDQTVYARLHTKHGGTWRSVDLTVKVTGAAVLIAPQNGELEFSPDQTFRWNAIEGAQAYYLYVGTRPGAKDLIDSRETQRTSWPATFLPAGQVVYARLHTKLGGVWRYSEIAFRTKPVAVFIEPVTDGEVMDPRTDLMWTSVPGAQAYFLYVGSSPGLSDVVSSGETAALSYNLESLPRGRLLHATLHTLSGGVWRSVTKSFQVQPVATLLPRTDGFVNVDTRVPLRWTAVDGADAYYLYVGTTPGAKDLINSRETQATEWPLTSLPPGITAYVRMFTKHGGVWRFVEKTITTKPVAYLNGPVAETGIWQAPDALTWTPYAGATRYYVYVGSALGLKDISSSGETSLTSFTMPAYHSTLLTQDRIIYVRLYSLVAGRWEYIDYTISLRAVAQLTLPWNGQPKVDVIAMPIRWNEIPAAEGYRLQLGRSPGSGELFDAESPAGTTELRIPILPGGENLHARSWTRVDGEWRYVDSMFQTRPAAAVTNPALGQVNVDLGQPIEWTSVDGADQYRLQLGSSARRNDIFDSGYIATNFVDASAAIGADVDVIYARLWTRHGGVWRYSETLFSTRAAQTPATMVWQTSPDAFEAKDGFRWTFSPMAASYRLRLGTTPGANDVYDSGSIRAVRHLVDGLPVGVQLQGSLDTENLDGSIQTEEFEFTVLSSQITFEDRWSHALWATAEVRGMAPANNIPDQNSLLLDAARLQSRETAATCTDYAVALLDLLRHMNAGIEARGLGICLNAYDCHKLVEAFYPSLGRWVILDPTFGLVAKRVSDGTWASAMDLHAATRDRTFQDIEYVMLTDEGSAFAEGYYMDYPLLYAEVYPPNSWSNPIGEVATILPYFDLLGTTSLSGPSSLYAIRCGAGSTSVSVRVTASGLQVDANGLATLACEPSDDGFTAMFYAASLEIIDTGAGHDIAVPRRFVFDGQ